MSLITIIGRGHSGTRAISHTLSASGVYMGGPRNESGDLLPPGDMYAACQVFARRIHWRGDFNWDWSEVFQSDIDPEFKRLIYQYLNSVLTNPAASMLRSVLESRSTISLSRCCPARA